MLAPNIGGLIFNLQTREGQMRATSQAVEKGLIVDPSSVAAAKRYYTRRGDYSKVINLCRSSHEVEEVEETFDPRVKQARVLAERVADAYNDTLRNLIPVIPTYHADRRDYALLEERRGDEALNRFEPFTALHHYRRAIRYLIFEGGYTSYKLAWEIALRQGLKMETNYLLSLRIKHFEASGDFVECLHIESARGNPHRAKIYENLLELFYPQKVSANGVVPSEVLIQDIKNRV